MFVDPFGCDRVVQKFFSSPIIIVLDTEHRMEGKVQKVLMYEIIISKCIDLKLLNKVFG